MSDGGPLMDIGRYSSATLATHRSIIKRLKKLGIDADQVDNLNINTVLKSIADSRLPKKYTDAYMSIIVSVLRVRNRGRLTLKPHELGFQRVNRNNLVEHATDVPKIKLLQTQVLQSLANVYNKSRNNEVDLGLDRSYLETLVAVGLVTSTNIRISELIQLKIKDLYRIRVGEDVAIHVKKKQGRQQIFTNSELYEKMYPYIIHAIAIRLVEDRLLYIRQFDEFCASPETSGLSGNRVISLHKGTLVKKIRQMYVIANGEAPTLSLGLKIFRTVNTSELLKNHAPEVAALFNGHVDINTAYGSYNLPDPTATLNSLNQ
jgi:integrase